MSARQNKKRRGNLNRARTFATDIPSDLQPPFNLTQTIAVAAPLTSLFSVTSSPGSVGNPAPTNGPHTLPSPSSFPPNRRRPRLRRRPLPLQRPPNSGSDHDHDSYAPRAAPGMQHPQQAQFAPDPALPRGQGDLEALERLKETIKNDQHEIFRATPRLDALASLYKGPLGPLLPTSSLTVPPHPEQMQSNPPEKAAAATTPSGGSFETVSSSGFPGDARYVHAPVQSAPLASGGPRLGISGNNMVPPSPRDQTRNPTNGRAPVTPSRYFFGSPSAEHADVNGGGATAHPGPNLPPSRPAADSAFAPREQPSPRGDPGNAQRIPQQQQNQMLSSPERRRPGVDNDRTARAPPLPPPAYPPEHNRERPPPPPPSREVLRPYDRERDWAREQQHEVERTHERERRWSLSDQRRFEPDRRSSDADRRPPSYDRRPPHLDEKRPPGFVDRRPLDDRRFPPDYDRRSLLSEESRFGIAPSQDSQEPNGNERRLSVSQAMKTGGPTTAPLVSSSATPSSTAAMTPAPVDSAADRDVAGDRRPISVHSSPAPMSVDGQRNSNARFVDERSSSQVASSQDRVSGTQPQLVPRAEPTRPGAFLSEGRPPVKPLENTGGTATPAQSVVDDVLPHARVPEPPHPERFSISAAPPVTAAAVPAADDRSRPVSVASSFARIQPQPRPPRASSPSGVPSAPSSLSLRAREPSREPQPPTTTFRPYFRSEFSRPPEDDRRPDMHPLPLPPPPPGPGPGDSFRRYDERSHWSPPPYAERRGGGGGGGGGYREYYDRDRDRERERERERERAYWDSSNNNNKDYPRPPLPPRDRGDRPHPPQSQPPHWDRGRARYSEPSYAGGGGSGADRRFSDDRDRDRWYPPPPPASTFVDAAAARRPFDTFLPRGPGPGPGPGPRPRSPSSPPPLKRARGEDGYAIPMSVVSGPPAAGTGVTAPSPVVPVGEYGDYSVPIPVPIPILRAASRSPPRYGHGHGHAHAHSHARPMHMEPYGGPPYGAYERDGGGGGGGRGPPGAAYAREGPR